MRFLQTMNKSSQGQRQRPGAAGQDVTMPQDRHTATRGVSPVVPDPPGSLFPILHFYSATFISAPGCPGRWSHVLHPPFRAMGVRRRWIGAHFRGFLSFCRPRVCESTTALVNFAANARLHAPASFAAGPYSSLAPAANACIRKRHLDSFFLGGGRDSLVLRNDGR